MRDSCGSSTSSGDLITAEAARAMLNPSESPEDLAITQLTDRIQNAIKTACLQRQTSTLVDVPDWLHGIPIFDRRVVRSVLKSVYRKLGYRLMSTSENSFIISWGVDDSLQQSSSSGQQATTERRTPVPVQQRRPALTYPSPPRMRLPTPREVITIVTDDKKSAPTSSLQVKLLKS